MTMPFHILEIREPDDTVLFSYVGGDALLVELARRLALANRDERRVIDAILGRLELGRSLYGHLDLSKPRDWEREAAEEVIDERFYRACDLIQRQDRERAAAAAAEQKAAEQKAAEQKAEQKAALVCSTCNDSHIMPLGESTAPCTRCPIPCTACTSRGGAYCTTTPCGCRCHSARSTR
ncbi:MAG: hypothetical protein ACTHU0_18415 [Kofleriaceae bacterium]